MQVMSKEDFVQRVTQDQAERKRRKQKLIYKEISMDKRRRREAYLKSRKKGGALQ